MAGAVELWGFPTGDVEVARAAAERILGVTFRLVESAEIGPYYFAVLGDEAVELTLRPNLDPDFDPDTDLDEEEALSEPDFPDAGVLLYADWRREEDEALRTKVDALGSEAQLLDVEQEQDE